MKSKSLDVVEPRHQLNSLLTFLGRTFGDLTPGERLDLELWAAAFAGGKGGLLTGGTAAELGSPFPELRDAQAMLMSGIRALRRDGVWRVDQPLARLLVLSPNGRLTTRYEGPDVEMFLARAADLITEHWHLVRACPVCPKLFVRRGRRIYCSTACSQKAQWEKFLAKHPKRERDYQSEHARRIKRRSGQTRIKTRRQSAVKGGGR
jgi:hypothetical protein